jgi:DNA-binding MarR family transcriptional regulator
LTVRQSTFDNLQAEEEARRFVRKLTQKQLDIISFLEQDYYQSYIAKRLKISRTYVNQTVTALLKHQLIKQKTFSPLQKKSLTYELTKKLKIYLDQSAIPSSNYTLCIPHHIKFKYPVLAYQGEPNREGWKFSKNRSIFIKSWQPKGNERLLFHVNLAEHTIGVEFHGKSIVAYRIEHTRVIAQTTEEATTIIASEIGKGVETFVREQLESGCKIQLGQPKQIDKTHYAFESEIAKEMFKAGGQSQLEGIYIDTSPEGQGRQNAGDIETRNPVLANSVDKGLRNAMNIDTIVKREIGAAMPQAMIAFNKALDPIYENVNQVMAMVQGGITMQRQYQQMQNFMTKVLDEIQSVRMENAELKKQMVTMKGAS